MIDTRILDPKARRKIDTPKDERIEFVQTDVFVPYAFSTYVLDTLEKLLKHPTADRMPCVLLTGRPGTGKSTLLKQFYARHPIDPNPRGHYAIAEVVYIQARQNATETRFYRDVKALLNSRDIITRLNPELEAKRQTDRLSESGWELVKKVGLKMPLIDEINNLVINVPKFEKPYPNTKFLSDMCFLHNEYKLAIVGAGIPKAKVVIEADEQLNSRFEDGYIDIPDWQYGQDFVDFLAGLEQYLPFPEASHLYKKPLATTIHKLLAKKGQNPTTKDIRNLIKKAAVNAIERGGRKVTKDDIRAGMSAIV